MAPEPSEHLVCAGRVARSAQSGAPVAPRLSGVGLGSLRGDRAGDRPLFLSGHSAHFLPAPSQPPSPCAVALFVFPARSPPPRRTNSLRGCPRLWPSSGHSLASTSPPAVVLQEAEGTGGLRGLPGARGHKDHRAGEVAENGLGPQWAVKAQGPGSEGRTHVACGAAPVFGTRPKGGDDREDGQKDSF